MKKVAMDIKQLEEEARRWVTSSRGQKAVQKAIEQSNKTTKKLQESRQVDPASLYRPFTV